MDHFENILVIDDDDDIRGAIAAYLEGEGYSVVEAGNGASALEHLRSSLQFCLILLDLYMPVMDGWAFRSEQKSDPELAEIPIIVISAGLEIRDAALQLGAVGAMEKPIAFHQLLEQVESYC